MRLPTAVVVAAVLIVGSCSGDDDAAPSPTTQPTSSTTAVDRSGIALAGVAGATTSTILERGTAQLTGVVQGPDGPVVGATVRIERLVADREIRVDLTTGPDGRFVLDGVPGGRYRVRAFLAPTLAQLEPTVEFLADGEQHDFTLVVEQQSGLVVRADVAPKPPLLGRAVNLVATVGTRTVGADGVVRFAPVVGVSVELAGLGRWSLRDDGSPTTTSTTELDTSTTTERESSGQSTVARTDSSGRVRFELRCDDPGPPGLYLRVPLRSVPPSTTDPTATTAAPTSSVESVDLVVPACVDPTTTTTASPASTTSTTAEP